jgi:hypothetical protein
LQAGRSPENPLKDQMQNRRVGHAFYPNRRIAMLKLNAAVCRRRRYWRARRVWRWDRRSIGLYIDNDR